MQDNMVMICIYFFGYSKSNILHINSDYIVLTGLLSHYRDSKCIKHHTDCDARMIQQILNVSIVQLSMQSSLNHTHIPPHCIHNTASCTVHTSLELLVQHFTSCPRSSPKHALCNSGSQAFNKAMRLADST